MQEYYVKMQFKFLIIVLITKYSDLKATNCRNAINKCEMAIINDCYYDIMHIC